MELNRRTLLETMAGILAASTILKATEVQSVLLNPHQVRPETHPFGSQSIYCNGSTAGLKSLVVGSLILKPGESPIRRTRTPTRRSSWSPKARARSQ